MARILISICLLMSVWVSDMRGDPVRPESLDQGFIIIVDDATDRASADEPVYLASNHVGWNPGDPGMVMSPRSDGRWQIILPRPEHDGTLQFKFTRGSWELCEVNADLSNSENRTLPDVESSKYAGGEKPVFEFEIPAWSDMRAESDDPRFHDPKWRPLDVTGDVRRIPVVGGAGPARWDERELLVWLPPSYETSPDRSYPVLYLMDGQNLFAAHPGVPAEWRVDETATKLIADGQMQEIIIVGVPHADEHRAAEYIPSGLVPRWDTDAETFVSAFLLREVMPRVGSAFRVRTGPGHTGIGGSSAGAMLALHAATTHPDVFGLVLAESTPWLSGDGAMMHLVEAATNWPERMYQGMGSAEAGRSDEGERLNPRYVEAAERFDALLERRGVEHTLQITDAEHNESAWAARLPEALEFLFPPGRN